jgi:hypothetical protein
VDGSGTLSKLTKLKHLLCYITRAVLQVDRVYTNVFKRQSRKSTPEYGGNKTQKTSEA